MKKLLLISGLLVLVACKKDKITPEQKIGGNFLCDVVEDYNYTTNNSDADYDFVVNIEVIEDTIHFDGHKFPLSSYDISSGSGIDTIYYPTGAYIWLEFSNDFNELEYYSHYPSYLAGPSSTKTISGTRTDLPETTKAQPHFVSMSGNYNLYIQETEYWTALDTVKNGPYYMEYDPQSSNIIIDGSSRILPLFHSYFNRSTSWTQGPYEDDLMNYYWKDDSLYYHFRSATGQSWPPTDTTHYHYQGSKL